MAKRSTTTRGLTVSPSIEHDSSAKKKKDDKPEELLSKTALDFCGKCKKKCKGESIQCDLCGLWAHASCEGINKDQYKAITTFSALENVVYYCRNNDCSNRVKFIINEWAKSQDTCKIDEIVTNLTQKHISNEYQILQKAVSDLSNKILHLQAQESDLCTQIKNTSVVLNKHPDKNKLPTQDRKCNVVVYGIDECPQNTPRNIRLQKDTDAVTKIFGNIEVIVEPSLILDCYRLGKYNPQKSKPRPILVKLQRAIDVSSILANKGSLSAPISIQPDKSPAELQIESILLKERWNLIQAGHQRKSIRINSRTSRIYLNNQVFGKVENSKFVHSTQHSAPLSSSNNQPPANQPMDSQEPLITLVSPTAQSMDRQPPLPVETQSS